MGRISTGRKFYDTPFKFAALKEYFSSDLSLSDFCKKKSIDRTTFRFWLLTFAPEGY
jgi:transposase-like protein